MKRALKRAALVVMVFGLGLCACHTMRFEIDDQPHGKIVSERKSYFLWGLVPTKVVDVRQKCPRGAVAVKEETSFVDGLLELPTLGIWSPRSSTYYCRGYPDLGDQ